MFRDPHSYDGSLDLVMPVRFFVLPLEENQGILSGRNSLGVELGEDDGCDGASEDTDGSICEEHAPDACGGVGTTADEREVRHRDVSGSSEEGEGSGGQRVVRPDGFEDDTNLDGERDCLKEELTKDGQSEVECHMWQDHEAQREEAAYDSVCEIERP